MTKDPYVVRINGDKQLLYGELTEGKKTAHKPTLRYKACIKKTLMKANIM